MKYIKIFENFFNRERKNYGQFRWYDDPVGPLSEGNEVEKLKSVGCFQKIKDIPAPFYYVPTFSDTIKLIIMQRLLKNSYPDEHCFYKITIELKNQKSIIKYFDTFEKMFKSLKTYIPEVDKNTKKYNL